MRGARAPPPASARVIEHVDAAVDLARHLDRVHELQVLVVDLEVAAGTADVDLAPVRRDATRHLPRPELLDALHDLVAVVEVEQRQARLPVVAGAARARAHAAGTDRAGGDGALAVARDAVAEVAGAGAEFLDVDQLLFLQRHLGDAPQRALLL